jgi:hypothetical protein
VADEEIVARARLGRTDFEAMFWALGREQTLRAAFLVVFLLAVVGWAAFARLRGRESPVSIWGRDVLLLVVLAAWLWELLRASRRSAGRLVDAGAGETTFRLSIQGVVAIDLRVGSSFRWDAFVRVVETKEHFLMETRKSTVLVLPRRAFSSPADEAAFRRLVELSGLFIAPA